MSTSFQNNHKRKRKLKSSDTITKEVRKQSDASAMEKLRKDVEISNNVQQAFSKPAEKKSWLKRIFSK